MLNEYVLKHVRDLLTTITVHCAKPSPIGRRLCNKSAKMVSPE